MQHTIPTDPHPCIQLYRLAGAKFSVGNTSGVCRITGQPSTGMPFGDWVKDTFTDHAYLHPGDIISNEAAFCFTEDSTLIQAMTARDKPQRFRTYSHIVTGSEWLCLTKADKQRIVGLLLSGECRIVCLTDSGQKHIFFKHRPGFWQLDETFVVPDLDDFAHLHGLMMRMLALGFGQTQVQTGHYHQQLILKAGLSRWQEIENQLSPRRGEPMFDFAAWLMFTEKNA